MDVDPFIVSLTNPTQYEQQYPDCDILNADVNGDGVLNTFDVDVFVAYISGHSGATGLRVAYEWDGENPLGQCDSHQFQPGRDHSEPAR